MEYFDTINDVKGLGGWFKKITGSHSCKGNDIADQNRSATRDANAQRMKVQADYDNLKNAPAQREIEQYEKLLKAKDQEIKRLKIEKEQIQQMAEVRGLGIFCRGANKNAERTRRELEDAKEELGKIKGKYNLLKDRHLTYLPKLRRLVDLKNQEINALKADIQTTKNLIEEKKRIEAQRIEMERMRAKKEAERIERAKAEKKENEIIEGTGIDTQTAVIVGVTILGAFLIKNRI